MVIPGSHRSVPLTRRCRAGESLAEFAAPERPVYAVEVELGIVERSEVRRNADGSYAYEKLEVQAGTLVLMHGNLVHASAANRSSNSRIAYNFGVVEGGLPWPEDAYLQPYEGHWSVKRDTVKSKSPATFLAQSVKMVLLSLHCSVGRMPLNHRSKLCKLTHKVIFDLTVASIFI